MAIGDELGSIAGGAGGKALGTSVAGPIGGIIGAKAGSAIGGAIGGGIESLITGGGPQRPDVPLVDPAQAARLREINRTRNQISSGTDPLTQQRVSEVKKTGETTKGQLAKFSGGDVGGTISSFLRAQRNTGKGINQAFQQGQARIPFFENLSTQLGNRIAQRKLQLNTTAADQASAERAQSQTNKNINIEGLIASSEAQSGLKNLIGGANRQGQSNQPSLSTPGINGGNAFSNIIGNGPSPIQSMSKESASGGGVFGNILGGGAQGGSPPLGGGGLGSNILGGAPEGGGGISSLFGGGSSDLLGGFTKAGAGGTGLF